MGRVDFWMRIARKAQGKLAGLAFPVRLLDRETRGVPSPYSSILTITQKHQNLIDLLSTIYKQPT